MKKIPILLKAKASKKLQAEIDQELTVEDGIITDENIKELNARPSDADDSTGSKSSSS